LRDTNFEDDDLVSLHDSLIVDGVVNMFFRCTGKKFLKEFDKISLSDISFNDEDNELCEKIKTLTSK